MSAVFDIRVSDNAESALGNPAPAPLFQRSLMTRLARGAFSLFLSCSLILALLPQPATAQANLQDLLQPNQQLQIDPNKLKVVPKPNVIQNPGLIACIAPFVPKNGKCVCPSGQIKVGNTCQKLQIPIACIAPFVPKNGKCVCPGGQVKVGNTCQSVQILCKAPLIPQNGQCVCPAGEIKVGNSCVTPQPACNPPFVKGSGGQCVCPAGLERVGNNCVAVQQRPQCDFPFIYNRPTNSCVCARGFRLSARGDRCVRQQAEPRPPALPQGTVIRIQRCLNVLGYNAGPVDGAPGHLTRSAWAAFRVDENLRARPNRLSDAVTQDRLFRACEAAEAAANQPPAPAPEPDPSPDPAPSPDPVDEDSADGEAGAAAGVASLFTNFDPQTGYPELQCASAQLRDALTAELDDPAEIGLCGEVCVPIPAGMTPEQIAATGANVNWCLNCARIGSDGLLCAGAKDAAATLSPEAEADTGN